MNDTTSSRPASEEDMEFFSYGNCIWFALALHDRTGWPLEVVMDEGGWIEHAWVRRPDGKTLDVAGIGGADDFIIDPNLVCMVTRAQLIDLAGGTIESAAVERAQRVIEGMGLMPAMPPPPPTKPGLRWKRR